MSLLKVKVKVKVNVTMKVKVVECTEGYNTEIKCKHCKSSCSCVTSKKCADSAQYVEIYVQKLEIPPFYLFYKAHHVLCNWDEVLMCFLAISWGK